MNPIDAKYLIEAMDINIKKLNSFELKFIDSVKYYINSGKYLSVKQSQLLQKLYRKTQGGQY